MNNMIKVYMMIMLDDKIIGEVRLPQIPQIGSVLELIEDCNRYKIISIDYRCAREEGRSTVYYFDDVILTVEKI